jgi:hypothetical protein
MVGRISTIADADSFYTNLTVPDQAECNARGIDYQPCVMPGDVTQRHRRHGDFMWRQFYNVIRAGCQGIYISMYDEFNEGNQIAKTAETAAWLPANSGMLALDEDGTFCSSDYYLRLTGDGGRMLKGQIALTATRPTPPVVSGGTAHIALRSHANNQFVTANNGSSLIANGGSAGTAQQFERVNLSNGNIALRSRSNNQYVCAEAAGAQPLIANRAAVGSWETFALITNPDGSISLRAQANNQYVCAEGGGAQPLIANRTAIGPWEMFDIVTT